MAQHQAQRAAPAGIRRSRGFTLMEMMVVVVVVGILAGIALPAYQESLRKGRRTDAKEALMEVANREEQYMLDRSTYTQTMTDLGYSADPMVSDDGHYTVDKIACAAISAGNAAGTTPACPMVCALATTTCYVLQARPRATSPQIDDGRCTSFSLDSTGAQRATGNDAANCW